ncbi:hypothetical protein ACFQDD_07025 [Halorubrum pallidum]|uniref:Uncharacterized protein n=1 Tax=Halorubrum pallidum TaxID=1526114 RepID=A0ABD5T1E5_9EURY
MVHAISPKSRVESLANDAVEPFGTDIMIDRVTVAVEDSHKVRTIASLIESAEIVDTRAFSDQTTEKAVDVSKEMSEEIGNVVDEVVAEECREVIDESGPSWWEESDVIMEEMVHEAVEEAAAWLSDHRDAADRAGVDVEGGGAIAPR